jgi:FkbM family methyltransferase
MTETEMVTKPVLIETAGGRLYISAEENQIGRFLEADGTPPKLAEEMAWLDRHVAPGGQCIDVGANVGVFTFAMAARGAKSVLAMEPNKDVLDLARKTAREFWRWGNRANDPPHLFFLPHAAGRALALASLRRDPRGSGGTQVVPDEQGNTLISTLDSNSLVTRPVSIIKIDAEGMDVDVLIGASGILHTDRPSVLFEWNPEAMGALGKDIGAAAEELMRLCLETNYQMCGLDDRPTTELWGNTVLLPKERFDDDGQFRYGRSDPATPDGPGGYGGDAGRHARQTKPTDDPDR